MNKADLVDAVASELGETRAAASRAVEAVIAAIAAGVRQSDKVALSGFGTFEKKRRASRAGVNPATGQRMIIPEAITVAFKPSQALKDSLPSAPVSASKTTVIVSPRARAGTR